MDRVPYNVRQIQGGVYSMDEKETVEKLMKLKEIMATHDMKLKELRGQYDTLEAELIEYMNERDMRRTATFDGVGHATLERPRLYASVTEENKPAVFGWLNAIGRGDLIKETVHPSTLSTFVKEMQQEGKEVSDKISVYLKTKILLKK